MHVLKVLTSRIRLLTKATGIHCLCREVTCKEDWFPERMRLTRSRIRNTKCEEKTRLEEERVRNLVLDSSAANISTFTAGSPDCIRSQRKVQRSGVIQRQAH